MTDSTRDMLWGHVQNVAAQLSGGFGEQRMREWHESEGHTWDESEEVWRDEDGDEVDDPDQWFYGHPDGDSDAGAYLENVLDIEHIIGSDGSYRGSVVVVGTGGPHIEFDTRRNVVIGYWVGETVTASFRDEMGLDDMLEEFYSCLL